MTTSEARAPAVGATFAVEYYTTLVQIPNKLSSLYAPRCTICHGGMKASGVEDVNKLLTTKTAVGLHEVKLEDIVTTIAASTGRLLVAIRGIMVKSGGAAELELTPFRQEVELEEVSAGTFSIVGDQLTYTAAEEKAMTHAKAAPTPVKTEAAVEAKRPEQSAAVEKKAEEDVAAAAPAAEAPVVAPVAKPTSFAEALRLSKPNGPAKPVQQVMEKPKAAPAVARKRDEDKKSGAAPAEAGPAAAAASQRKAAPVVYYDLIIKELPTAATEDEVRDLFSGIAGVKLVNLVRRQRGKEVAENKPVFAFVQLDHTALAASGKTPAEVMAELVKSKSHIHVEAVRERKFAADKKRTSERTKKSA